MSTRALLALLLTLAFGCAAEAAPTPSGLETQDDVALAGKYDEWNAAGNRFFGFEVDEGRAAELGVDANAARRGLEHVYAGRGFRNGFPIDQLQPFGGLFGDLSGIPSRKLLELFAPRLAPEEMFKTYGLVPSPPSRVSGRRDDAFGSTVSLGQSFFQRDRAWLVNNNCFICHAGAAGGQVVAGAANAHLDQAALLSDLRKVSAFRRPLRAAVSARQFTRLANRRELTELDDFFGHLDQILEPSFKHAESRGDNLGPYAVWMGIPRLVNPGRSGLLGLPVGSPSAIDPATGRRWDDYVYGRELYTVDPNAWWQRKYRRTSYWYGETASDDVLRDGDPTAPVAAHFAFNFTTPHADVNDTHREHVGFISDILAFAEQLEAPPFPGALDASLVQRGAELFHGEGLVDSTTCSSCHGSYAKEGDFDIPGGWAVTYADTCLTTDEAGNTTRLPRLFDDGTDPSYNDLLRSFAPLAERVTGLTGYFASDPRYAPTAIVPRTSGYIAPPLDGVWASAPYLHNGSVPTLEALLSAPSERPQIWQRSYEYIEAYDYSAVGLACTGERCDSIPPDVYESLRPLDLVESIDVFSHTEEWIAFRAIYDTRGPGRSNAGHYWGYRMTPDERAAMLEFLKSLGGPGMTRVPGYEVSCEDGQPVY